MIDWIISITTLLVNSGLGWTKGKAWMWYLHAVNSLIWIIYSFLIKQYGLIFLAVCTIIIDIISAIKRKEEI